MVKKVVSWMERHEWFLICLAAVVLLRIPSLFEPYWYGDEAIYLTIGQALRKGLVLYSQIHDNKPPFLYLIAALSNGQIFWFKFWAGIFNLLSIGVFYRLANKIAHGNKLKINIATWVFSLLTTLPILEGNIANAEIFFLLFTVGAFYILWTEKKLIHVFWGGIVLGLGALFKMPPLLEAAVWPIYWLITREKKWLVKSMVLGLGVLLPIVISGIVMTGLGAGREYLVAAWAQNLPYLTSWKATSAATGVYSLKNRAVILVAGILAIYAMRKRVQKSTIAIALWTAITWFASLMSGRPYPHYLLQMAPVIALWVLSKPKMILGWTMVVITWILFQFYIYPVCGYYTNFGKYIFGQKSYEQYLNTFNPQTATNYKLAEEVKLLTTDEERIFVWGDEPVIYSISQRLPVGKYVVKYHVLDFEAKATTLKALQITPPKLIIDTNNFGDFPELSAYTSQNYLDVYKIGSTTIWKLTR